MRNLQYPYKAAALYGDAASAEAAIRMLRHPGLGGAKILQLGPGAYASDSANDSEADEPHGAVSGVAFPGAMEADGVTALTSSLFVSVPVVAPLIILGYGSLVGGSAGPVCGTRLGERLLTGVVRDVIKAGCYAVLVHSVDEAMHGRAQALIGKTMAGSIAQQ